MKIITKLSLLCFTMIGLSFETVAHPVDQEAAKAIAFKFMETNDLQLSTTYRTENGDAALFVFNTQKGFVIVAADDCETPIIGYSHDSQFDPNKVPIQLEEYLQDFVARIQYGIENHIVANETTARQWELVKSKGRLNDCKNARAMEPLITAQWHQGCLYNSLCPVIENAPCDHAQVGCVAVAMAQIMHYWGYPTSGWGSHSYSFAGTMLTADFGNTTYEWDLMPEALSDSSSDVEINAVATLLYHCGIAVNMNYSNTGSITNSQDVPDALIRYFNYSRHLYREKQANFTNDEWISLIKSNLDLRQPIFYAGSGSASHAFVCDGYDDNDLLHFNWGWGGNADGYFALGNLTPAGNNFSKKNSAIFDIVPHYEPWTIAASVDPSLAGTVEGTGEYHIGETCTLTAIPAEGCEFYCWKQRGDIKSYEPSISFEVNVDIDDYVACFSYQPINELTASCPDSSSLYVDLSWSHEDTDWVLLKQFDIHGLNGMNGSYVSGIATDGKYIYTSRNFTEYFSPFEYDKYTMDGDFVEQFNLDNHLEPENLAYDGRYFYCRNRSIDRLYCVNLADKTVLDSIDLERMTFCAIAYDSDNDGFWVGNSSFNPTAPQMVLIDRQGQILATKSHVTCNPTGMGYINAIDGTQHLLVVAGLQVFDFNITHDTFNDYSLVSLISPNSPNPPSYIDSHGASISKYDDKDALYVVVGNSIQIYEIRSTLAQIMGYRIYRTDENGNMLMLSDMAEGHSFIDTTWVDAENGEYRFGISSVFANGNESEIVWSNPVVKTGHGIEEHDNLTSPSAQKVFEDGQIVIIKDGKKYSITGQEIH